MRSERKAWEDMAFVGLFLLAWILRVAVALEYQEQHPLAERPVIDERSYDEWAHEIAAGDWLGDEVFFQEPLYPYWLAASYTVLGDENRTGVRHLQALVGAVTALLVGLLGRRLFGPVAGIVAGTAMALHQPAVLFPSLLLKPNLVLPVVAGLALLLLRTRHRAAAGQRTWTTWLGLGALAGAGALLRGNLLLLLPWFCAVPVLRALAERRPLSGAWRSVAACALGVALVLGPVAARNAWVGGAFVLTTSGAGTNVYGGNNEHNPYGRAKEFPWVRGIPKYEADDWRHEAERRVGRELEPDEVSRYWLAETGRSLLARPGLHASIFWNKLRLTLGAYEVPDNHHVEWDARYLPLLSFLPGFGWWGTLSLAGALLFVSWRPLRAGPGVARAGAWECLAFLALYVVTIVLTVTSMRARLAIVPMLFPFAGAFVAAIVGRIGGEERGRRLPLARLVPLALAAGAIVLWPVFSREDVREDLDKRDFNHAVYLQQSGEFAAAEALAAELDARYPGSSRVLTLRAQLEFERGADLRSESAFDSDAEREGRELIRTALERLKIVCTADGVAPREVHRARVASAAIQEYLGNFAAAENHYREALDFDPESPVTLIGLASSLLARAAEAEAPDADGTPPDRLLATARRREALGLLEGVLARGLGPPGLAGRVESLREEIAGPGGD